MSTSQEPAPVHPQVEIEERIVEALVAELERQAAASEGALSVQNEDPPDILINGRVDLDKLATVVMGALAGGP